MDLEKRIVETFHLNTEQAIQDILFSEKLQKQSWEELQNISPTFPRGWYELLHLSTHDRIEFLEGYWKSKLPYAPEIDPELSLFFSSLKEIESIILFTSNTAIPILLYLMDEEDRFFYGQPPATESKILELKNLVPLQLPEDFLSFFSIHNGFSHDQDQGLIPIEKILQAKEVLYEEIEKLGELQFANLKGADQNLFFPFYQSLDLMHYQCFYQHWYPDGEMGNVCVSLDQGMISHPRDSDPDSFVTFLHWLVAYLNQA